MTIRAKGKQRALTAEELQEQLNKLKEEELRSNEMRQPIHQCMVVLQQGQAPRPEPEPADLNIHQPIRPRP